MAYIGSIEVWVVMVVLLVWVVGGEKQKVTPKKEKACTMLTSGLFFGHVSDL